MPSEHLKQFFIVWILVHAENGDPEFYRLSVRCLRGKRVGKLVGLPPIELLIGHQQFDHGIDQEEDIALQEMLIECPPSVRPGRPGTVWALIGS